MGGPHKDKPDSLRLGALRRQFEERLALEGDELPNGEKSRHEFFKRLIDYALEHMPKGWKRDGWTETDTSSSDAYTPPQVKAARRSLARQAVTPIPKKTGGKK